LKRFQVLNIYQIQNVEIEKNIDNDPRIKAGLEYRIIEPLFIRSGFNTQPNAAFGGIGGHFKSLNVDYSIGSQEYLGYSHQVSINFILNRANR